MYKAIVAVSPNGLIGSDQSIPWKIKEDLKYFQKQTDGHTIVMGRKTFSSIGRVLPNRKNVVLTRDTISVAMSKIIKKSLLDNIFLENDYKKTKENEIVWVIGGSQIYELYSDLVEELHVTYVISPPVTKVTNPVYFPWHCYNQDNFILDSHTEMKESKHYKYFHSVYRRL